MFSRKKDLAKIVIEKTISDAKWIDEQHKRIAHDIKNHEQEMVKRRAEFKFIRNK